MKLEALKNHIQQGDKPESLILCDELYQNLRDFSQCVALIEKMVK